MLFRSNRIDEANKTLPADKQFDIPEKLRNYFMGSESSSARSDGHYEYRTDPKTGKQQQKWVPNGQ